MTALLWLGIAGFGGVAAILRFRLDEFVQGQADSAFPFGTMTVNLLGSFVLGVLTGAGVTGDALLLSGTGVLGSFTTFSTWMLEATELPRAQAAGYIALSLVAGLGAVALPTLF